MGNFIGQAMFGWMFPHPAVLYSFSTSTCTVPTTTTTPAHTAVNNATPNNSDTKISISRSAIQLDSNQIKKIIDLSFFCSEYHYNYFEIKFLIVKLTHKSNMKQLPLSNNLIILKILIFINEILYSNFSSKIFEKYGNKIIRKISLYI